MRDDSTFECFEPKDTDALTKSDGGHSYAKLYRDTESSRALCNRWSNKGSRQTPDWATRSGPWSSIGTESSVPLHSAGPTVASSGRGVEVIEKEFRAARTGTRQVPADLLPNYVSSTFVLVLKWWLDKGMSLSPKEINNLFRGLAMSTLAALAK